MWEMKKIQVRRVNLGLNKVDKYFPPYLREGRLLPLIVILFCIPIHIEIHSLSHDDEPAPPVPPLLHCFIIILS